MVEGQVTTKEPIGSTPAQLLAYSDIKIVPKKDAPRLQGAHQRRDHISPQPVEGKLIAVL